VDCSRSTLEKADWRRRRRRRRRSLFVFSRYYRGTQGARC